MKSNTPEDLITDRIIGVAIDIHKQLGPGLFESVYERILAAKLERVGFQVERQKPIGIQYEDIFIPEAFIADLIVEGQVIIEIKSIESLSKLHKKQLLTYLRLSGIKVGLLINFNCPILVSGIERIVNNLPEEGELSF